ncbi:MAG: hypothetical protein ACRDMA_08260 [Solirubrobacterales bacterium]
MDRNPIAIYLNDHLAGATAGVEVARRARSSNEDNPFGDFLRRLTSEIEEDRGTLRSLMSELGVGVDRAKQAAAWGSEKVGRLKPNGRLVGYAPLSRLVELEFLAIGITGKLGMWRALQHVLDEPPASADLASLIERADRQRTEVDEYRLRAADEALPSGIRPG